MSTPPKIISIIKALETIDPTLFERLCSDLVYAGAFFPELKEELIRSTGLNEVENHTVPSPQDGVIRLEEGLCVFEYSRAKRWKDKLKSEVEKWAEREESQELARFVFITSRDIGNKKISFGDTIKLTPEEFIQEKLTQPKIKAYAFGLNDLLRVLRNKEYSDIRRKWLNIPEDYFQSIKSFESNHIKQAQDRHIYLEKFVETPPRKQSINVLERFIVNTDVRVLLIHSQGGIGKTRFVLETLKRVKERTKDIDILFNRRKKYIDVDEVITEISEAQESLIVLDDPHLIDNLADFEEILIGRNRTKFILISRSTAKESVTQQISYPMEELELTPLDRESSIELLKGNVEYLLLDQYLRHLGRICEGNPLLIGLISHLINTGTVQSFGDLKTDDLVRKYLETILADLNQYSHINRNHYEPYLALLFLLKPFSVDDVETRSLIQTLANIDEVTEGLLRRDLEQCAILERHGSTLWLYPDLLGEYLVKTTFFADRRIQNFDEIFSKIPSSHIEGVFKTLREIDSAQANQFLKGWARSLSRDIESQDNDELSDNLRLLEIIASIVSDETLEIIAYLLKPEREKPPKAREDMWSPKPRHYSDVLCQCLRILKNSDLTGWNFDETLEMFLTMHFYQPQVEEYSALRKEAFEAIVATAAHNLNLWQQGCGYTIQTQMFGKAQKWKQEDLEKYLPLILGVCENLLQTEMKSEYTDSEGIGWSASLVVVTEDLINLRKDVIFLLQSIFGEIQDGQQQIRIIRVLNWATTYPSWGRYGEDMKGMIRDNAEALIDFYLGLLTATTSPDVEVLQAIEEQIHRLRTWHQDDIKNLDNLLSALQSYESYQLYRTLVSDTALFWINEGKSYDEIQTETADKIKKIADEITHVNLIEWLGKLNSIAENFTNTYDQDISRFYQLLFEIGKSKPHIARALIDKSLSKDNALKRFTAEFVRGIRKSSHPDIAGDYVRKWLSSEDQMLLLQIPNTYWRIDEKSLAAGDVQVFETLLNCKIENEKQRQKLDKKIMSNIGWIYKTNPEKTIDIICKLFERADQNSILHHMNQLWWSRERIDLSHWNLSVFENLLQTFVDIPMLNDNAVYILAQYGQKAPLELVQFFERRVEKQKQTSGSFSRYDSIPPFLKELGEIYRKHRQYLEIINQILRWFRKDDYDYETAAADLISGISPEINHQLRTALLDLVRSDSAQNILAAMKLLEKYADDPISDELYEEIVKHSANDRELQKDIKSKIISGGAAKLQRWRKRLNSWRTDDNEFLCEFSQREIKDVESSIEFYERLNAEHEIKRKKGLL